MQMISEFDCSFGGSLRVAPRARKLYAVDWALVDPKIERVAYIPNTVGKAFSAYKKRLF